MENVHQLCYILSASYSGSTLLSFLLNSHPLIATTSDLHGERLKSPGVLKLCSCGQPLDACPFWKQVEDDLIRRSHDFDPTDLRTRVDPRSGYLVNRLLRARMRAAPFEAIREFLLRRLPSARSEQARVLERNRLLIATILRLQGGEVFLDSGKNGDRLRMMLRPGFWNIKVIHLIRDGRGSAYSRMKWYGVTMKKGALIWRRAHEQAQRIIADLPKEDWLRIHYENLATRPRQTIEQILDFLGLDRRGIRLDFRAVEHHMLGNMMRLKDTSEIVLDEKWKAELSARDLATFDRIAGQMNCHFGYGEWPSSSDAFG